MSNRMGERAGAVKTVKKRNHQVRRFFLLKFGGSALCSFFGSCYTSVVVKSSFKIF